jgi:hypothetical protein
MDNILLEDYINYIYSLTEEDTVEPGTEPVETPSVTPLTLTKEQLRYIINNSKGKIMTIVFRKKDGELRTINTRTGVKQNITGKGLKYDPDTYGYIIVWDMQKKNYRTVNLDTVTTLKAMGKTYAIKEAMQRKPVYFKNGPIFLQGEQAWRKWKSWTNINKHDSYVYEVLDTIRKQDYLATEKQQSVLNKWFDKKS